MSYSSEINGRHTQSLYIEECSFYGDDSKKGTYLFRACAVDVVGVYVPLILGLLVRFIEYYF